MSDDQFEEIRPLSKAKCSSIPTLVEAYVATVSPKDCFSLVRYLSAKFPLSDEDVDMSHLRRVKRERADQIVSAPSDGTVKGSLEDGDGLQPNKRQKKNEDLSLEIFVGLKSSSEKRLMIVETDSLSIEQLLKEKFHVSDVRVRLVPSRPAESKDEWVEFSKFWPTVYLPNRTIEFRESMLQLSGEEVGQMLQGMKAAIADAVEEHPRLEIPVGRVGTVIMDPASGVVVAKASEERLLQKGELNPLATSVILAIQFVSRSEREKALKGGMDDPSFQQGQYLCTGYDVYTTREPSVFEAMALVHSRVRRVIFGCPVQGTLGGFTHMQVHGLPGTNHKYRVFMCDPSHELSKQCNDITYGASHGAQSV